jgi:O-antigen/teichoic acid export membrane protein
MLDRGLGVIRIVVLARLLAPEDFGSFGIALLAVSALDRFTRPGLSLALVQRKGDVTPYVSAVWTALLLRAWGLGAVLFLTADLVARFFNDQGVVPLLHWAAVATVVGGFRGSQGMRWHWYLGFWQGVSP